MPAVSFILAAVYYPGLPEKVAVHWGSAGSAPDGYMGKFQEIIAFPSVFIVLAAAFFGISRISKLKSIPGFTLYLDTVMALFFFLLCLVHVKIILFNAGLNFIPDSALKAVFNIFIVLLIVITFLFYRIKGSPDKE